MVTNPEMASVTNRELVFDSGTSSESYSYGRRTMDLVGLGIWKIKPDESPPICLSMDKCNYTAEIVAINWNNLNTKLRRNVGLENTVTTITHYVYINVNEKQIEVNNHVIINVSPRSLILKRKIVPLTMLLPPTKRESTNGPLSFMIPLDVTEMI